MAGDDKQGLDALMASMGVRPLRRDERTHQKPRKKDARAPKKSSAPASPKISAPKASAVSAALPQSAPAATDDATEKKLRALRDANAALEKRLAETTQQLGDLRASHSDLEKEVETLDRERRVLQRRVESSANGTQSPPPTLGAVLGECGVLGEDEAARVLGGFVESRRIGPLLDLLEAPDAELARAYIDDATVLLGGCDDCPQSQGRVVLAVPRERCQVCGGSDVRRAVRRFIDACLVHGLRHILVVGGAPKYHRQLRELVDHHRVRIECIPGTQRRTRRQAQMDMGRADAVLIWGGTQLDHSVSDLYKDGPSRVIRLPKRGVAQMLELASKKLSGIGESP